MSVTPSDILETARLLATGTDESVPSEANFRSSASRAYYAAMHAAFDALPQDLVPANEELQRKESHKIVCDALALWARQIRNGRGEAVFLSRQLPRMKHVRKKADYKIGADFTADEALEALKAAQEVIESATRALKKCTNAA